MSSFILALTKDESILIESDSLCVIGGSASTGRKLSSLKERGDYAVVSREPSGSWLVHSLVGKKRGARSVTALAPCLIDDLTLVPIAMSQNTSAPGPGSATGNDEWLNSILQIVRSFSEPKDLTPTLMRVLELFQSRFGFEKGLVVLETGAGEYQPVVSQGLKVNDPWLSESLIQDTLKSQTPITVGNVIGSRYDHAKSLIATGFISLVSWPLVLRGKVLGALTVGSVKPHSGLSPHDEVDAQLLVSLAALLVQFQQRDQALRKEIDSARARLKNADGPFVTQSPEMRDALQLARDVAPSDLSILIQGETGVGKEVLANWIHELSSRAKGPFVAVNCAAIPRDLLESVLFGHKRGAFTGAAVDQTGKFVAASGGTIFLDEIGELPMALQAKILRAVQERTIEPLGSNKSIRVDVRFISATHRTLTDAVRQGEFREDLFYRLAEVVTTIPSLRKRRDDIPLLAAQIMKEFAPEKCLTNAAWSWLRAREWPGNVRELRSTLKRVALLARGADVDVSDLTRGMPSLETSAKSRDGKNLGSESWLGGDTLDEARNRFTAEKVREALIRSHGHRSRAAELLGVTPRTLFRYLDEFADLIGDMTHLSRRPDAPVATDRGADA